MKCPQHMFIDEWLPSLPLPGHGDAMGVGPADPAAADYINDEAFKAADDAIWLAYKSNPYLGPQAMADLVQSDVGRIRISTMERWLEHARTVPLPLERLRLYKQCVVDFLEIFPNSKPAGIEAMLLKEFNVKVQRQTMDRLRKELERPEGVPVLTQLGLDEHEIYLQQQIRDRPNITAWKLLQSLQEDKEVTSPVCYLSKWMNEQRQHADRRRIDPDAIPNDITNKLWTGEEELSLTQLQDLLEAKSMWCHEDQLKNWLQAQKNKSEARREAKASIKGYWSGEILKQCGAACTKPYPASQNIVCPASDFKYWTYYLSWTVCQNCGRRDLSHWKNPEANGRTWNVSIPKIAGQVTCKHRSFWQQACPMKVYELEDKLAANKQTREAHPEWAPVPGTLKGSDVYVCPERRHWPIYDPAGGGRYVDAPDYRDAEALDDPSLQSMLDLSPEEANQLAPIRIFSTLKAERGKKSMVPSASAFPTPSKSSLNRKLNQNM